MKSPGSIWRPDEHPWTRDAHIARFMRGRGLGSLAELRQASVRCPQWFWDEALRDVGLEWFRHYTQVRDVSRGFAGARWFVGGEINVTHNCIDRHVRDGHGGETALWVETASASDEPRRVSFAELGDLVNRGVLALRAAGVQRGDAVALGAPMRLPAVVVLFAAMKLGARVVPLDDGGVAEQRGARDETCGAKLMFAARSRAAKRRLPALRVVWLDGEEWERFLDSGGCIVPRRNPLVRGEEPALPCASTAGDEACLVFPRSGNAGSSRPAIHTHAGCLAQAGKDLRYAFDIRAGEPFWWAGETEWKTAVWTLIGCLLFRAPVVLFDGEPEELEAERLWRTCARLGVVTLGGSPAWLRRLRRASARPERHDLSKLRVLGSSDGAWDEAGYRWYFERVGGARCPVIHSVGGGEIFGAFVQPYAVEPLKTCSCGGPALGLDVDVVTPDGRSAPCGTAGRIVCRQPAPSLTGGFPREDAPYVDFRYTGIPGVWCEGDRMAIDEDGEWFLADEAAIGTQAAFVAAEEVKGAAPA